MPEHLTGTARYIRPEVEACEYVGPEGWYWSKGDRLYYSEEMESELSFVARAPAATTRRCLAATRLGRRLGRHQFYNVMPLSDGSIFYSFDTRIGVFQNGKHHDIRGRQRQSRILRNGIARLPNGGLLFGEYFNNPERESVRIYQLDPVRSSVDIVYEFSPGAVRHVHSVNWDPHEERVVVATGDVGPECRLLSFSPDFSGHRVLGEGTESWRSIAVQFTQDHIFFGTDAQFEPNKIRRYDRSTGTVEDLVEVNGPVFYSARFGNGWVFGTSAELCPSQTSPEAVLHYVDGSTSATSVIGRLKKDRFPTRLLPISVCCCCPPLHAGSTSSLSRASRCAVWTAEFRR